MMDAAYLFSAVMTTTSITVYPDELADNASTTCVVEAGSEPVRISLGPPLPPNYSDPLRFAERQSDDAPGCTVVQVGFWRNACGRRRAA